VNSAFDTAGAHGHTSRIMMDVILDVDTGIDDALALLLAVKSPALNVLGVTCVDGNCTLEEVARNTLAVLDWAGATRVPVALGASHPLCESPSYAYEVHGKDGLGEMILPASSRKPVAQPAVAFLRQALLNTNAPITIIALGPLTNIALLLVQHPEVKGKIARIVNMGGSMSAGGNATAAAEFNIRHDPEAADIVYRSGVPILMYGLDVFRKVRFSREEAIAFTQSNAKCLQLAGRLLLFYMDTFQLNDSTIGDAGAVACTIDPAGLTTIHAPVMIELAGRWTRGMTVVDQRIPEIARANETWQKVMPANADVAMAIDAERYCALFKAALAG
jgi:pyrimidine-specific ribonucleoside hydrolase